MTNGRRPLVEEESFDVYCDESVNERSSSHLSLLVTNCSVANGYCHVTGVKITNHSHQWRLNWPSENVTKMCAYSLSL